MLKSVIIPRVVTTASKAAHVGDPSCSLGDACNGGSFGLANKQFEGVKISSNI